MLATARSRQSATPTLRNEITANSQSQAAPQAGAPAPSPTIRHSGPRACVGSPCFSHSPSVHCLCKLCNPDLNARNHPRPAPHPTSATPPATRAPLPTVRAGPFVAPFPGSAAGLATSPGKAQSPARRPASFGANACLAPAKSLNDSPAPQSAAGPLSPAPDTPQTPPKHTPRRLKSFLEKTLTAREALAQHPANTPQRPRTLSRPLRRSHAPCPGDLPAHPRRAYGPTRPVAGPSLGAVVPGVRSSESRSKKSAQTVSRQPVPSGDGLARDGSPPSPPRLCGPRPPRRPCTLSVRSTVTLESRS